MTNPTTPPGRITVAEAFRRVKEAILASTDHRRYPDHKVLFSSVRMRDADEHWVEEEPKKASLQITSGKEIATSKIPSSFLAFCSANDVKPRSLHDPWSSPPYTGSGYEPFTYDIAVTEYEQWAAPYLERTVPWQGSAPPASNNLDANADNSSVNLGQGRTDGGADEGQEDIVSKLFDPVTKEALEKMFPANGQWKNWAERASRNGLDRARELRATFNPFKAAVWFLEQGEPNWDLARCKRVLAKNLPLRSQHEAHLLVNDLD